MANLFYHLFFWSARPLAPAIVSSKEFVWMYKCLAVVQVYYSNRTVTCNLYGGIHLTSIYTTMLYAGNNIGTHIYHDKSSGECLWSSTCMFLCVGTVGHRL